MKVTRDFDQGTFSAKAGESLSQDQMKALGRTRLVHLKDIAQVVEGDIPADLSDEPASTIGGAITAEEALRQGQIVATDPVAGTGLEAPGGAEASGSGTKSKTKA